MRTVQIATRVNEQQSQKFKEITTALGTSPSDALRMFIAAFISEGGFPYQLKVKESIEAFKTEEDATEFATRLSRRMTDEVR